MKKLLIAVLLTPLMVSAGQKKPAKLDSPLLEYEEERLFQRDLAALLST